MSLSESGLIAALQGWEEVRLEEAFIYHIIVSVFDIYYESHFFCPTKLNSKIHLVALAVSLLLHSWLAHDIFTAVFLIMSDLATFQAEWDLWPLFSESLYLWTGRNGETQKMVFTWKVLFLGRLRVVWFAD